MSQSSQQPASGPRASLERVHQALDSLGLSVRTLGGHQVMAHCPIHPERTGSFSVTWRDGRDGGKVLLNCFGCGAPGEELAAALGLTLADLFDEPLQRPARYEPLSGRSRRQRTSGQRRGRPGRLPRPVAKPDRAPVAPAEAHEWVLVETYPYYDAEDKLVQEVVREKCVACEESHKRFRQVFVGASGRRLKTKPSGFEPVLYRHPQVLAAVASGTPVWLVEGEKDVATAEALGLVATTNTQGAKSFPANLVQGFTGARVEVVLDRDEAGWDRGVQLAEQLTPAAERVRLWLPAPTAPKSDLTDHIEAGHTIVELEQVHVFEVQAWAMLARIQARLVAVEQALAETHAQQALAAGIRSAGTAPKTAEEHDRFAHRWATESEIRYEALTEQLSELEVVVLKSGTEWAAQALDLAVDARDQAQLAARTAHEAVDLPIPAQLHPDSPAASAVPAATPSRTRGPGNDASTGEEAAEPGEAGTDAGFRAVGARSRPGTPVDQPTFRIVDHQIVMVDRNGRRPKQHEDPDPDGENLKLILGLDVCIHEMEYLEEEDEVSEETVGLMGRENTAEQAVANPKAPAELSAVVVGFSHPATGETMRLRINADQWRDGSWLESLPGPPDYDPKPAGLQTVRRAIKAVSRNIEMTTRHRSTGWRATAPAQVTCSSTPAGPSLRPGPWRHRCA